jgi:hypothetical protein
MFLFDTSLTVETNAPLQTRYGICDVVNSVASEVKLIQKRKEIIFFSALYQKWMRHFYKTRFTVMQ